MKVLVIGATGYMGTPATEKLQAVGYQVLGLARSDEAANQLEQRGIEPVRGDLTNPESIAEGTLRADAVINIGAVGGVAANLDLEQVFKWDQIAAQTIINALSKTNKPYIHTSGSMVVADLARGDYNEKVYDEQTPLTPPNFMSARADTEKFVLEKSRNHGVHAVILRPSHTYGRGGSFFAPQIVYFARKLQASGYVGKGENVLSFVHVEELADLYVLALKKAPPLSLYNVESNEATMKQIASVVSRTAGLGGGTQSWSYEEASQKWSSSLVIFAATNERITAEKARRELGWNPQMPSILEEIEDGSYRQLLAA